VKITWRERALGDYRNWQKTDPEIFEAINRLIKDIQQGRGKPKVLQRELKGWLSRQITKEQHRLVYRIRRKGRGEPVIEILQCRGHY
jgi:Txe/YoeB family toxin of toxin-antitoxin system